MTLSKRARFSCALHEYLLHTEMEEGDSHAISDRHTTSGHIVTLTRKSNASEFRRKMLALAIKSKATERHLAFGARIVSLTITCAGV